MQHMNWDSAVSKATRLQGGQPKNNGPIPARGKRLSCLPPIQTVTAGHTPCCLLRTRGSSSNLRMSAAVLAFLHRPLWLDWRLFRNSLLLWRWYLCREQPVFLVTFLASPVLYLHFSLPPFCEKFRGTRGIKSRM
jgi:hypothetical protein